MFNILVNGTYELIKQQKNIVVIVCGNENIKPGPIQQFVQFTTEPIVKIPYSVYDVFFLQDGGEDHLDCYAGRRFELFNGTTCSTNVNATKVHFGNDYFTDYDRQNITLVPESNSTLYKDISIKKFTRGLKTACAVFQEMTCYNSIKPKYSLFPFYVQKNKGTGFIIDLLTLGQMNTLFALEEVLGGYCGVSEWHVTPEYDSLNEITSAD